ncbi:hypothetical protein V2G26_010470 [Clonostachys chloroleuca]
MPLLALPTELFLLVQSHLDLTDIKHMRLSSRKLCASLELRIDRVFLSANPRNVEVFLAIAAHETLRRFVTEIVWDDAVFTPFHREEPVTVVTQRMKPQLHGSCSILRAGD